MNYLFISYYIHRLVKGKTKLPSIILSVLLLMISFIFINSLYRFISNQTFSIKDVGFISLIFYSILNLVFTMMILKKNDAAEISNRSVSILNQKEEAKTIKDFKIIEDKYYKIENSNSERKIPKIRNPKYINSEIEREKDVITLKNATSVNIDVLEKNNPKIKENEDMSAIVFSQNDIDIMKLRKKKVIEAIAENKLKVEQNLLEILEESKKNDLNESNIDQMQKTPDDPIESGTDVFNFI